MHNNKKLKYKINIRKFFKIILSLVVAGVFLMIGVIGVIGIKPIFITFAIEWTEYMNYIRNVLSITCIVLGFSGTIIYSLVALYYFLILKIKQGKGINTDIELQPVNMY